LNLWNKIINLILDQFIIGITNKARAKKKKKNLILKIFFIETNFKIIIKKKEKIKINLLIKIISQNIKIIVKLLSIIIKIILEKINKIQNLGKIIKKKITIFKKI
jgi:hypothetical protein